MAGARAKQLERARALEKAGKAEEALAAYKQIGAVDEAARLLSAARRFDEGARLLAGALGVAPANASQLDAAMKKRALMAAILFSKAGDTARAVELFLGLGERQRAAETLQKAGDSLGAARALSGEGLSSPSISRGTVGGHAESAAVAQKLEQEGKLEPALESYVRLKRFADAARIARALGRTAQAAELYAEGGVPYEAARCYNELGDTGKSLDNLVRVARDDARYRHAALLAVRLASHLNVVSFNLEHFLGAFVRSGPQSPAEEEAFYALAALYVAHGDGASAEEAFDKLVARNPAYRDAARRLRALREEGRATPQLAAQLLADDAATRSARTGPDPALLGLSDLPLLPPLDATATLPTFSQDDLPLVEAEPVPANASEPPAQQAPAQPPNAKSAPARRGPAYAVGDRVADRYELEAKIGEGGMAAVFRAHDRELDERVALKVFGLDEASDVAVARFKQELKLTRQLQHPNIIRYYDIGLDRGHRYISMELLTGETLKARLARGMTFPVALQLLEQACSGLGAAHAQGVVHRDVKPDNFFVTSEGLLKVMDFGIARQQAAPGVTIAGTIAGTPAYMSPEQINSFSTVTQATDLYALGVMAYEMFTGTLPFAHPELVPLLMMHATEAPQPPRERNPEIPEELERVILRLLEKDPARRYADCAEVRVALSAVSKGAFWSAP